MASNSETWLSGEVNEDIQRVFPVFNIIAPPDSKFKSYSLLIGARTEQLILVIPLEACKARFGLGPESDGMASFYFHGTIRTTTASYWFFGTWTLPVVAETELATPQST